MSESICGNGKTVHATRSDARRAALQAGNQTIYPCRFCHGWHTSSADILSRKDRERRRAAIGIKARRPSQ